MTFRMPPVRRIPSGAVIAGGMDVVVSPMFAKPGLARLAYNYEYSSSGGIDRISGIEPYDGHPSPSAAIYVYMRCSADIAGIAVGDTVTGVTSSATGLVIYVFGAYLAVTKITGAFEVEDLQVGGVTKATVAEVAASVDGFLDNDLSKAAADAYQVDIGKVPGNGTIRGIAILKDKVYAWRNDTDPRYMNIYVASSSGWTLVPMLNQVSFTAGTAAYVDGDTLTQGGVSATIKRVVLESGDWGPGTAAGRFIVTNPTGGHFAFGAAVGGGACTLSAPEDPIVLSAATGSVRTYRYAFTTVESMRLYGCDEVNPEFEFDGEVWVPLNTGMGTKRARAVVCFKHYLMFAYDGSLQLGGLGNPYQWSPVVGAGELATGDMINDMLPVGGQSDAAALFMTCQNSLHVLYGTSTADFNLVPLSHVSGGQRFAAQDIGGIVTLDTPGIMRYPVTRSFGNFSWDNVSTSIRPLVKGQKCRASVYASNVYKYRLFFEDGTAVSGLPIGNKAFAWSVIDYGRNIMVALCDDIDDTARTFYGDDQGWVYEADLGRSFAGEEVQYGLVLHPLSQSSPLVEKTYRYTEVEVESSSAFTLKSSAQFGNNDDGATEQQSTPQYGAGGVYDLTNFDQSYWDTASVGRLLLPTEGPGTTITLLLSGKSDRELTHTLYAVNVVYTPRKVFQ